MTLQAMLAVVERIRCMVRVILMLPTEFRFSYFLPPLASAVLISLIRLRSNFALSAEDLQQLTVCDRYPPVPVHSELWIPGATPNGESYGDDWHHSAG